MKFTERALQPTDLDAMASLWQASAPWDPCGRSILHEKVFEDERVLPELQQGAFLDDALVGVAVAAQLAEHGFVKLLCVHPLHRRQGIGRRLLNQLERTMTKHGVTTIRIAESAPNYLTPGVDKRNEEAHQFLAACDYRSIGIAYNQRVDLEARDWNTSSAEQSIWDAHQLGIRRAIASDREPLKQLLARYWPSWNAEVSKALAAEPAAVHVAHTADSVVAFAAFDGNNVGTGWFGPMGTDPAHTGKGLGRVLLHRCLADMQQQGRSTATIPWVGPLSFYEQHAGAQLDRTFTRFEKTL